MTNALAWAITTGELWCIRITSLLGWVWESPLHLGGYADLEKHPTEAVDPGSFDVRFSGDGIDSWLRGWMLLASIYGKTFGADVYDDVMRSVQKVVALHRSRPSIHTKQEVSRGLYSLLYRWHDEMRTASKVQGAAAAYPYSPWELLRAQETGCYIPRLDFSESSASAKALYFDPCDTNFYVAALASQQAFESLTQRMDQMERGGRSRTLGGEELGIVLMGEDQSGQPLAIEGSHTHADASDFGPHPRSLGGEPFPPGRPAFPRAPHHSAQAFSQSSSAHPKSHVATSAAQRQPVGAEVVKLDADIMSAAYKGLPRAKRVGTPNAPAVEICPWANTHGGCMSGGEPQGEEKCSRSHAKKDPTDFDHAAHAMMAGRGGHWALPEVKGYAACQQLATGYWPIVPHPMVVSFRPGMT